MGCDIHLVIEYRPVVGHSRPDAEVRALLRAIEADPTPALAARLRSWEIRSESWEPACFDYYIHGSDEEEDAESGHREPEVRARRSMRAAHPERFHTDPGRDWAGLYALEKDSAFCDDRSYEAFAKLTGTVRNYDRFDVAQCFTEKPRGLPADVSVYTQALSDGWDGDGHSHSWLTVAEILPRIDVLPSGYADMVRWWAEAMPPEHVRLVFFFDN